MYRKETDSIRKYAQVGLWGAVAAVILASLFLYASPWTFGQQSDYVRRWMLVAGSVLAVLAVSMALLVIRRQVPRLRQSESLSDKLTGYATYVRSVYLSLMAVVILLCLMVVLSRQNVLLMLAIVTVLVLFLNYPNIYRLKVDLGLSDDEMRSLYGEKYIGGDAQQ